ncbi:MAG TPA: hypothetical protein VE988_21440 [Gemmataceae bacterium]|nr:hypothetical protein [Gemmataceae bacterium]
MFTVRMAPQVCLGFDSAVARAATARQVIDFAAALAPSGFGVLESNWFERDGRYVVELYDWIDCWFTGPLPVLAVVTAPADFTPPA